jgi:hypothetical protein
VIDNRHAEFLHGNIKRGVQSYGTVALQLNAGGHSAYGRRNQPAGDEQHDGTLAGHG